MPYREDLLNLLKDWSSSNAGTIYLYGSEDLPSFISVIDYASVITVNLLQTKYYDYLRKVKVDLALYNDSYYAIDLYPFKPFNYVLKISGGVVDGI